MPGLSAHIPFHLLISRLFTLRSLFRRCSLGHKKEGHISLQEAPCNAALEVEKEEDAPSPAQEKKGQALI